jgi:hypothetical protein
MKIETHILSLELGHFQSNDFYFFSYHPFCMFNVVICLSYSNRLRTRESYNNTLHKIDTYSNIADEFIIPIHDCSTYVFEIVKGCHGWACL